MYRLQRCLVLVLTLSIGNTSLAEDSWIYGSSTPADHAAETESAGKERMLSVLRSRAAAKPDHSDTWRMIGRLESELGNSDAAMEAVVHALQLDPHNAAAHFDVSELLLSAGDFAKATEHRQQVFEIAPHSKYAEELRTAGFVPDASEVSRTLNRPSDVGEYRQVGYEIQTFDGNDDADRRMNQLYSDADPELKRLRVFLESGVLYNSNVTLTPNSRELTNSDAGGFQGFLSPELEWIAASRSGGRIGPLMRGYFTLNERQLSGFDLANIQPGAFLERDFSLGESELIGRLDYVYSLDFLDGDQFADRHAITASLITIRPDLDVIYIYLTTSFSDFDDDGIDPAVTSLDGTSITGGISRFFQTDRDWIPQWSLGADIEDADTDGADFRYLSLTLYADATLALGSKLSFVPEAGVGGRDYPDFTGAINRDEVTWRVRGKLRWQCNDRLSLSAVAGHDRFASDNDEFDAERTQGGVITTLNY